MTIKRTNRRTGISCRVLIGGEVEIRAGYDMSDSDIDLFLSKHKRWLARSVDKMRAKAIYRDRYSDGTVVLLHGRDVPVRYILGKGTSNYDGDTVTIYYDEDKSLALHIWYIDYAKRYLTDMFSRVANDITRVVVRDTKTYYGICYRRAKDSYISLNAKLIGASDDCIRYVIHHEVAHLTVPNHSKRFYEVLSKSEPEHSALAKKLRESVLIVE